MIVAFGYRSRSGKDTAANMFASIAGKRKTVIRDAFAEDLKDIAYRLYGRYGLRRGEYYNTPEGERLRGVALPVIGKTPVQIWVELGMKAREIWPDTWLDFVLDRSRLRSDAILVVSDVRFVNEAEAIKREGGYCIRVDRSSAKINPSDVYLDNWNFDYVIDNNGSLADLEKRVSKIVEEVVK